jgi:hypothetical protein
VECGGRALSQPEDYGCGGWATKNGEVLLRFDYGTLHEVYTPDGMLTPFGSCISPNWKRFLQLTTERLSLIEVVPQRNDAMIDELAFQLQTSGPTFRAINWR